VNDQAHQLMMQLIQKVNELGSKEAIQRLKIASDERKAAAGDMAGIIESEIKAGQQAAASVLTAQLQAILKQLDAGLDVQQEAAAMSAQNQDQGQHAQPTNGVPQPPTGPPQPQPGAPSTALLQ
jgi:hypothetical protein